MAGEGLKTAIEVASARAPAPAEEPEQLPLMPLPLTPAAPAPAEAERSGPGRPPGARNKRTEAMIEYLERRYRPPLVVLAETYSRRVEDLARELGISKRDAFELQQQAAIHSLPYWHQKQPVAIAAEGGLVQLILGGAPGAGEAPPAAPSEGGMVLEARIVSSEENQGLSEVER